MDSSLKVAWQIINVSNFPEKSSDMAATSGNCVIIRDNLLKMAFRVLELNRSSYHFLLYGGEPTLHPHLHDLVSFLLLNHNHTHITVATNGSWEIDKYSELLQLAPCGRLKLLLNIPAKYADLDHTLGLIKSLRDRDVLLDINLIDSGESCAAFQESLQVAQVQFNSLDAPDKEKILFSAFESGTHSETGADIFVLSEDGDKQLEAAPLCFAGANFLSIDPAGHFRTTLCPMTILNSPLYRGNVNPLLNMAQVLACNQKFCPGGLNDFLPKFKSRTEESAYRKEFEEKILELKFSRPPVANPLNPILSDENRFLLEFVRQTNNQPPSLSQCQFLKEYFPSILKIYSALDDDASIRVFIDLLMGKDLATLARTPLNLSSGAAPLKVEKPVDASALRQIFARLGERTSNLLLPLDCKNLFEIPLLILKFRPDVKFRYLVDNELLLLAKMPESPEIYHSGSPIPRPKFSIILDVASGDDLSISLDSALIQQIASLEVLVVGCPDNQKEILRNYIQRFPMLVRETGTGCATSPINSALGAAIGEYICFLRAGDVLPERFLVDALVPMEEKKADIVCFDHVWSEKTARERIWGVTEGETAGLASLERFLLEQAGPYCFSARVFRGDLLRERNIHFTGNGDFANLLFQARVFLHSTKTLIFARPGYYAKGEKAKRPVLPSTWWFENFSNFTEEFSGFFDLYGLDQSSRMYVHCVNRMYAYCRDKLYYAVMKAARQDAILDILNRKNLFGIGKSKAAVECVLRDYAAYLTGIRKSPAHVAAGELDWRAIAARPFTPAALEAYGNASDPTGPVPILSVILPNYNKEKYLDKCLASILEQPFYNYELIIVDDCSTDSSFEILKKWADNFPQIRLFRLDHNCRQGICRNLAIELARGDYLTFMDTDDLMAPNFLGPGMAQMLRFNADIGFFSMLIKTNTGKILRSWVLENNVINPQEGLDKYLTGYFQPGPVAKIFRTAFVRQSNARYAEYIYHQDHFFIVEAIRRAQIIISSDIMAYEAIETPASSIRASKFKWLHIHSGCHLFKLFDDISNGDPYAVLNMARHARWTLESVFLLALQAYLNATGEVAISEKDYRLLGSNLVFLTAIFLFQARLRGVKRILPPSMDYQIRNNARQWIPEMPEEPIVSIIMPTYNQEDKIGKSIESILGQKLRSLELIIINDGSTDHTLTVCQAYSRKDPRIIIINNSENRAQGYCRNLALAQARGKYVIFADSDDYVTEHFLHGIAQMERIKDADILILSHAIEDGQKKINRDYNETRIFDGREFFKKYFSEKYSCRAIWAKIYRREVLAQNDVTFPEHFFEDSVFLLKAFKHATKIVYDPAVAYVVVPTPHTHSTMKPLKYTLRHLHGHLAYSAFLDTLYRDESTGVNGRDILPWITWRSQCKPLLEYIADFREAPVNLFSGENLDNLRLARELVRVFIQAFANLYFKNRKQKPVYASGAEDCHFHAPTPAYGDQHADLAFTFVQERSLAITGGQGPALEMLPLQGAMANFALGKARGAYVVFTRGIDSINPAALVHIQERLREEEPDAAFFAPKPCTDEYILLKELLSGRFVGLALLKRDFLSARQLFFAENSRPEDVFWISVLSLAEKIIGAQLPLALCGFKDRVALDGGVAGSRALFASQLQNLEWIQQFCGVAGREKLFEAWIDYNFGPKGHFKDDFLGHVLACQNAFQPNPVDDEALDILGRSKIFLPRLIMEYACLFKAANK